MKKLLLILVVAILSGCTISSNVVPVKEASIEKIFVKENDEVFMKELDNEIVSQIKKLGFESDSYQGKRPIEAKHYLTYTANWAWDLAMYLTFFEAKLYEDDTLIGEASYDARSGSGNMGKFGQTSEKIKPLLRDLLEKVARPESR